MHVGEIRAMVGVNDLARSVSFYTDVLGMSELATEGKASATMGYEKHPNITIKLLQTSDALTLGDGYRGTSYPLPNLARLDIHPTHDLSIPACRTPMPEPYILLNGGISNYTHSSLDPHLESSRLTHSITVAS
jgi:hypothetical protein